MSDELLANSDQEEALSRVYACAVAGRAGYVTADYDFDRDGIDLRIQSGGAMRPALEFQLKATINLDDPQDGHVRFALRRRNYDLLIAETQTPRLLMVLDLPRCKNDWMSITRDCLVLRRRAYWANLKGCRETTNTSSITVEIPETNLFDVNSLQLLMEQSRKGIIQ